MFRHKDRDIKLLVHGDDFLVLGDAEDQTFMQKVLSERYEYRCDGAIGEEANEHLTILNRIVSYDRKTGAVMYEADPRHAEMIIRQLNLQKIESGCYASRKEEKFRCSCGDGTATISGRTNNFLQKPGDESAISCTGSS